VKQVLLAALADTPRVTQQADSLLAILPFPLVSEFSWGLSRSRNLNVHNLNVFQGKLSAAILAQHWLSRSARTAWARFPVLF
jgi:hypothetical protein